MDNEKESLYSLSNIEWKHAQRDTRIFDFLIKN